MGSTGMSAARQSLEALLVRALTDPSAASGYSLQNVSFGETVEVSLEKGGATFVLWVRPASDDSRFYKQTARFKIGYRGEPPDRLAFPLIDAVRAQMEAWEGTWSEREDADLFAARTRRGFNPYWGVEWLAVRAGLKPSCRILVESEDVERLLEYARADGLHLCITDADRFVAGFCAIGVRENTTLIHAARAEAAAGEAAAIERAMIETSSRGERVTSAQVSALGAALGYPPCCIEAFIRVRDFSNAEIRFQALRRTPWRAPLVLNNLVEERALVSHCLCRYDCPPSMAYAQALFQELARIDPAAAEALQGNLSGLVVSFRQGGVLRLTVPVAAADGPHRFTDVEASSGEGGLCEQWLAALRVADGVEVLGSEVRILGGAAETCRLVAPPDEVQIRLFA